MERALVSWVLLCGSAAAGFLYLFSVVGGM